MVGSSYLACAAPEVLRAAATDARPATRTEIRRALERGTVPPGLGASTQGKGPMSQKGRLHLNHQPVCSHVSAQAHLGDPTLAVRAVMPMRGLSGDGDRSGDRIREGCASH